MDFIIIIINYESNHFVALYIIDYSECIDGSIKEHTRDVRANGITQ